MDQHVDIESFDDNTYYSRLYRRQQNTIQRLRNSEENRLKNREIRLRRIQQTQSDKKKNKNISILIFNKKSTIIDFYNYVFIYFLKYIKNEFDIFLNNFYLNNNYAFLYKL